MLVRHAQMSWGLQVPGAGVEEELRGGSGEYVHEVGFCGRGNGLGGLLSITSKVSRYYCGKSPSSVHGHGTCVVTPARVAEGARRLGVPAEQGLNQRQGAL